jgi:8-oxo-dGTP pyrophosphatase MutT (NUDIX family)
MFKGAGILFYKKENNQCYISLGKRTINPHKNFWSVPGGKLSRSDENDLFKCALRETCEEYFKHNVNEFKRLGERLTNNKKSRLYIPFIIDYQTYLIDLSGFNINFHNNWEFSKICWFNINNLPAKTHFGVKYSLRVFGLNR